MFSAALRTVATRAGAVASVPRMATRAMATGPAQSAEISDELAAWAQTPAYTPWDNYTVKGPLAGLGELPLLARMALLPRTRRLLSPAALGALEKIFLAWLSPRSKVEWAAAPGSCTARTCWSNGGKLRGPTLASR